MTAIKSEFIRTLVERGFMHQCTDLEALDALAAGQRITAYIGYDCTAPSLHVGSLVQIMMQRHLQKTGHRPIVLMGGGTTKIGDPSGKDAAKINEAVENRADASHVGGDIAIAQQLPRGFRPLR